MTFYDTKKNNGYHSLSQSYFDMFRGPLFSGHGVVVIIHCFLLELYFPVVYHGMKCNITEQ